MPLMALAGDTLCLIGECLDNDSADVGGAVVDVRAKADKATIRTTAGGDRDAVPI